MSQGVKNRGYQLSVELVAGEADDDRIIDRLESIKSRRDGGKAGFVRRALIAYIDAELAGAGSVGRPEPSTKGAAAPVVVAPAAAPLVQQPPLPAAIDSVPQGAGNKQSASTLAGFMDP